MRTRSFSSTFRHYVVDLAVASLIPLIMTACVARQRADERPRLGPTPERTLAFENATTEPVSVFLEESGSQWLVGHVMPFQSANLRFPFGVSSLGGREFRLVVVPASARRAIPSRASFRVPGPITGEQLRGEYLASVRWKLTGNWLVSLPIARAP